MLLFHGHGFYHVCLYCVDAHDRSESKTAESKLGLPRSYHKSYRINFTFVTPEMKERGNSKGRLC